MANYVDQFLSKPPVDPNAAPPAQETPTEAQAVDDLAQTVQSPDDQNTLNVAIQRGNTLATENPLLNDLQGKNPYTFIGEHGMRAYNNLGVVADNASTVVDMAGQDRSILDHASDDVSAATTGFVGGLGDTATFLGGTLNNDVGAFSARMTNEFRNWMQDNTKSSKSKDFNYLSGITSKLDADDNNKAYARDKLSGDKFTASLAYLGRGLINGASRLWDDPGAMEDGLSQGVGSLLAGGVVGRALGAAGGVGYLGGLVERFAMPLSIALQEGGGAYNQTITEVMGMSNAELQKTSPSYRKLLESGVDPDTAKEQVAANTARIAGLMQAPVGAATGLLVSKFEAHPTGAASFKEMVGNILRETTEEGLQSAGAQVNQNLAIKAGVDPNRSVLQDVGDQTAQGAILGGLTAGVVQVPKVPKVALDNTVRVLKDQAGKLRTANETKAGLTDQDISETAQTVTDNLSNVLTALDTTVADVPGDVKEKIDAPSLAQKVKSTTEITDQDVEALGPVFPHLIEKGDIPNNRIELNHHVAKVVNDPEVPKETKDAASLYLLREQQHRDSIATDFDELLDGMDQTSPEHEAIRAYQNAMQTVDSTVNMKKAVEQADDLKIDVPETGPVPEATVKNVVAAATVNPIAVSKAGLKTVLKQADDGHTTLTPEERKALEAATAVHDARETRDEQVKTSNAEAGFHSQQSADTEASKNVSNDIFTHGRRDADGKKIPWALSAPEHVGVINDRMMAGDIKGAKKAFQAFSNFALSQRNKANATLRSYRKGGQHEPFTRVGAYGKVNPVQGTVQTHTNSPGSIALARLIHIEANTLAKMVNDTAARHPELGIEHSVPEVAIPEEFFGKKSAIREQQAQEGVSVDRSVSDQVEEETPLTAALREDLPTLQEELQAALDEDLAPNQEGEVESVEQQSSPEVLSPEETAAANEETVVSPQREMSLVERRFPRLIRPLGALSRFVRTFTATGKETGRFLEMGTPLTSFIEATKNSDDLLAFLGEDPTFDIDANSSDGLRAYLNNGIKIMQQMQKQLEAFALQPYSKSDPTTLMQYLHDGVRKDEKGNVKPFDVVSLPTARALGILEKTPTGQYRYNPALLQTAVLAALDWYAQSQNRESHQDKEDISKATGIDISDITEDQVLEWNAGVGLSQATRSLGHRIEQFWGLKGVGSTSYAHGIPEGLGKEILAAMEALGWYSTNKITMNNNQPYIQFDFTDVSAKGLKKTMVEMGAARKAIELVGIKDKSERIGPTYGKPPRGTAKTQMRNRFVENTPIQIKAQLAAQRTGYQYYEASHDMQRAIGLDGWIELMGSILVDDDNDFNKQHLASVEGTNRTFRMAFEGLEAQVAEAKAHLGVNDTINSIKKFFQFNHSRVGRLQMLGAVTPQGDQTARHVWLPSRVTLDLTDKNSDHHLGFFMAMAQGLGHKTHLNEAQENADWAFNRTMDPKGDLFPLVQELADWYANGRNRQNADLREWSQKAKAILGKDVSAHAMMSLLSAAEYQLAAAGNGGGLSEFETHNYFEADGITNGVANALANMTPVITPSYVEVMKKAGFFIGNPDHTMSDQKDEKDIYETNSDILTDIQRDFGNNLQEDIKPYYDKMFRMMRALGIRIVSDGNGSFKVERNALKNPTMITAYGSGVTGIAGNVVSEMLDNLYAAITDHLHSGNGLNFGDGLTIEGKPYGAVEFWTDFNDMVKNTIVKGKKKFFVQPSERVKQDWTPRALTNDELRSFKVEKFAYQALTQNMRVLFVNNMSAAIHQTLMTHIKDTVDHIQKITNVQSVFLKYMYRKESLKLLYEKQSNPDKYPDYAPGQAHTQQEEDDLMRKMIKYGALIQTEHQTFLLGAGEQDDILGRKAIPITVNGKTYQLRMPTEFSRRLDKLWETGAFVFAPSIAGVSGMPSFNLGTGDGRAMDIYLTQDGADTTSMPVFDGINLRIDKIFSSSRLANQAVSTATTETPATAIAESLKAFMAEFPHDQMFDENDPFNFEMVPMLEDLTKAATGLQDNDYMMDPAEMSGWLEGRLEEVTKLTQMIEDRVEAQARVGGAVDQMAGAQQAAVTKGTSSQIIEPLSATRVASMVQQEINNIVASRTKGKEGTISGPNRQFVSVFRKMGKLDHDHNVLVADISTVNRMQTQLNNRMTDIQREMLAASVDALSDSDFKVVFGTPENIDRYEQHEHPDTYEVDEGAYLGKIDVDNRVIYLTNPSVETLTHEMIHAATVNKMQGYYSDARGELTVADQEAMGRLEGLMNEWLLKVADMNPTDTAASLNAAVSSILNAGRNYGPAAKLNEFLAWTLSNQEVEKSQRGVEVKNPLFKIAGKVLVALKQLIWGHQKAPAIRGDMFSQVRFNARVLMASPTPIMLFLKDFDQVTLYQSSSFGSNDRLNEYRRKFSEQVRNFVQDPRSNDTIQNEADFRARRTEAVTMLAKGQLMADTFSRRFGFTMQQKSTFKMIQGTISVADRLSSGALDRMQDIYSEFINKLKVDDYLTNQGDAGVDQYHAQQMFEAVSGVGVTEFDLKGRSSLLPNFIALAAVDDQTRAILSRMKFSKKALPKGYKADEWVDAGASRIGDILGIMSSGQGIKNADFLASMDALTHSLVDNVGEQRSFIEQRVNKGFDQMDAIIKTGVEKTVERVKDFTSTLTSPLGRKLNKVAEVVGNLVTEKGQESVREAALQFVNQDQIGFRVRESVTNLVGRTKSNAPIYDMISEVRTLVDQTRDRWRTKFPGQLKALFAKKLTPEEWGHLHTVGKADASALYEHYTEVRAKELLVSASERDREIGSLEGVLTPEAVTKAKQLAHFMLTGEEGVLLHRNTHAIAQLTNSEQQEVEIDKLVTLYAVKNMDRDTHRTLRDIINNEPEGYIHVMAALMAARRIEAAKNVSPKAKLNVYKGHMPETNQDGVALTIADRSEELDLIAKGYERLDDYHGDTADTGIGLKSYYFTSVSGQAKFNQGVTQTVQHTQSGTDPTTGYTIDTPNAGRIVDPRAVAAITRRLNHASHVAGDENLRPVFGSNKQIVAYERMPKKTMLSNLNPEYNLANALGLWRGRQSEEATADHVNETLVDRTHQIWEQGKLDHKEDEFFRLDTSTDPVIQDAWRLVPFRTKEYIEAKFGPEGWRVRKDMYLDVLGARSATVGDFWTGNTRYSDEFQTQFKDLATTLFGNDAFKYLVSTENVVQQVVSNAKVQIVIKSVVVPMANLLAGVWQLSSTGVPWRNIYRSYKQNIPILNNYIKRKEEEQRLENALEVATLKGNSVDARKLSIRLQTLRDSYKRMDIHPLLEAGEFGSITDGGVTQEDLAIAKGGYAGFVDRFAQKIPKEYRDFYRYGMVTRDTSMFKLLSRAAQYGDFLAKAAYYEDLTVRKKMKSEDAIAKVSEAFINYNRFTGRNQAYLESMGMLWFYQFKLRSIKVAQQTMTENPLRAILHSALTPRIPLIGTIGTPLTDNWLALIFNGTRLENSVGPGQLFRAYAMNPWYNFIH